MTNIRIRICDFRDCFSRDTCLPKREFTVRDSLINKSETNSISTVDFNGKLFWKWSRSSDSVREFDILFFGARRKPERQDYSDGLCGEAAWRIRYPAVNHNVALEGYRSALIVGDRSIVHNERLDDTPRVHQNFPEN